MISLLSIYVFVFAPLAQAKLHLRHLRRIG